MYFGLTPVEVRKLAFDITYKNNLNIYHSPGLENRWLVKNGCVVSWSDAMTLPFLRRKSSNIDWASCEFQRRFEEHAALFYVNLKIIRECNNFESKDNLYTVSVDETDCTTVQKPATVKSSLRLAWTDRHYYQFCLLAAKTTSGPL